MISKQFYIGKIVTLETPIDEYDVEDVTIEATAQGIRLQKDKHIGRFISYQDLMELLDGQGIIKL